MLITHLGLRRGGVPLCACMPGLMVCRLFFFFFKRDEKLGKKEELLKRGKEVRHLGGSVG